MEQSYLCISIPAELQQYTKDAIINNYKRTNKDNLCPDFGVKLIKDEQGNLKYAAYYSDTGELIKKIFYNGSSVESIEYYRNNYLYSQEKYYEGKITKIIKYDKYKNKISFVGYEYNRNGQIVAIRKTVNDNEYLVEYGYDDLMRVNSRIIKINNDILTEQRYKYDILDRIVEYKDDNQLIKVLKINPINKLILYEIIDKAGNIISITNKFICSEYIGTEIVLNGHKTTILDESYTDNVMLKKPFTSEDDLDLVISRMFNKASPKPKQNIISITRRSNDVDITHSIIKYNLGSAQKPLSIVGRKLMLLQKI